MRDQRWQVNGFYNLEGGIDSGNAPSLLKPNQCAFAVNATMRDGFAQCRPGFVQVPLTFATEDAETNFKNGRFQGAREFRAPAGNSLVVQISGRTFRINFNAGNMVNDVSIAGDLNPANCVQAWMQQAEQWLVIQDGQSVPLIWNGSSLRRSNLVIPEVPSGGRMAYVMGRLVVSGVGKGAIGRQYAYGDLYGTPSATTTPSIGNSDAVLKFVDNTYLLGGGAFSVPMDGGGITGMIPIATPNTILGDGPLLISTADTIFASQVPLDRQAWANLTYPVQTIQSVLNGALSHESMVQINSDVWFRARDGWRSFVQALRDFSVPGNTPQSHEMSRITELEDQRLLPFCSAVYFNNYLIGTAWPQRDQDHGVWHKGLSVLDFSPVTSLQMKSPPAWVGFWTGLRFLRLVSCTLDGMQRLFAFALNKDTDEIELWEITKDARFDEDDKRINWSIETRGFEFKDRRALKKLEAAELWIDRMAGDIDIELQYIPDAYPCPWPWATHPECAKYKWCPSDDPLDCKTIKDYQEQYRSQIEFPSPADVCLNGINTPARLAYTFQAKLVITGFCRIPLFLMYASPQTKTIEIAC